MLTSKRRALRGKSPACNCKGNHEYLTGQSDDEFDSMMFEQRELECIERNYHWRTVRAEVRDDATSNRNSRMKFESVDEKLANV